MFTSRLSGFQVSIPKHALLDSETTSWIAELAQPDLSADQVNALALMRGGQRVSNAELRQLGVDGRAATVALTDLVARGLAMKIGGRRYAEYELADDLAERDPLLFAEIDGGPSTAQRLRKKWAGQPRRPDRMRDVLNLFTPGRTLSAADVQRELDLSRAMVTRYLARLIEQGSVEPTGPPRSPTRAYRLSQSG